MKLEINNKMATAELIKSIEDLGEIYQAIAPFEQQLRAFKDQGIKRPYAVSVRDASFIRLNSGLNGWTRTCHAPICAKNEPYVLVRHSPVAMNLRLVKQATKTHANGKWFYQPRDFWKNSAEQAKTDEKKFPNDPEKRKAIIIPEKLDFDVTSDSDIARFLWQDTREDYFNQKVSGNSVRMYNFNKEVADSQEDNTCIVNYLWFGRPGGGSGLGCWYRDLCDSSRAFGVLKKAAEGSRAPRKKDSEREKLEFHYKPRELDREIKRLGKISQGKVKISDLESEVEKVSEFLKKLKQ